MSKSTISTFQLFALIPDAETARVLAEPAKHVAAAASTRSTRS